MIRYIRGMTVGTLKTIACNFTTSILWRGEKNYNEYGCLADFIGDVTRILGKYRGQVRTEPGKVVALDV